MGKILVWVVVIIVALMVMRIFASRAASKNLPPRQGQDSASRRSGWSRWMGGASAPGAATPGKTSRGPASRGPASRGAVDPTLGSSEPMVRCAHCGIFLPRNEALMQYGKTWCSHDHAKLGVRQQ